MAGSQFASAASVSCANDMVFVASVASRSAVRIASSSAGTVTSMARARSTAASARFFNSSTSERNAGSSKEA